MKTKYWRVIAVCGVLLGLTLFGLQVTTQRTTESLSGLGQGLVQQMVNSRLMP